MEPLVAAKAGPFELLVPCIFAERPEIRPNCTGDAVVRAKEGYLCENCYTFARWTDLYHDTFVTAYHRARERGLSARAADEHARKVAEKEASK